MHLHNGTFKTYLVFSLFVFTLAKKKIPNESPHSAPVLAKNWTLKNNMFWLLRISSTYNKAKTKGGLVFYWITVIKWMKIQWEKNVFLTVGWVVIKLSIIFYFSKLILTSITNQIWSYRSGANFSKKMHDFECSTPWLKISDSKNSHYYRFWHVSRNFT